MLILAAFIFPLKYIPVKENLRPDDQKNLFFFELKKGRTTKVNQVKEYVNYYSAADKLSKLKDILSVYPVNPVKNFDKIRGVMVMQFSENSFHSSQWTKLSEQYDIDIIFFEKYLSYKK